ncbi:MAG: hypothetical protein ACOY4Q_11790 [Bacillota bacterium]
MLVIKPMWKFGYASSIRAFNFYILDVRAIVSSGYSNDPVMANYPE